MDHASFFSEATLVEIGVYTEFRKMRQASPLKPIRLMKAITIKI